jgi:hypothetical protein
MRFIAGIAVAVVAGCAASPPTADNGPLARCSVTDCLNVSAIRDYDIVDGTTAVVYVGPRRCPFVVSLDGFNCRASVAPALRFLEISLGGQRAEEARGRVCGPGGNLYVYTGLLDPGFLSQDGFPRTRPGRGEGYDDAFPSLGIDSPLPGLARGAFDPRDPRTSGDLCRVQDIRSITDDQLLELLVDRRVVPPPPPIGSGRIEVPPQAPPP